jgi:hypothetical protein
MTSVDLAHDEERGAQRLGRVLTPPGLRNRRLGQLSDLADHVVLRLQVIGREDRDVRGVGRDPRNESLVVVAVL